ncbi:ADM_HP2_G0039980.mRNA.1.CDS.1 [Saccharomyces cerevisiae]|nr:ADM_HP2_G0039980.mRNA.1.CDS.1 [Saccharomyces cerevisiae]CAI6568949.1 ADM_HP2_G0039980.mRNA.1.CDS.1 [Saccharomyces cerevisiae]
MSKGKVLLVLYENGKHAEEQEKLLGCIEATEVSEISFEEQGYELVTTITRTPEPTSTVDRELKNAEIVITTPFSPPTSRETGLRKLLT